MTDEKDSKKIHEETIRKIIDRSNLLQKRNRSKKKHSRHPSGETWGRMMTELVDAEKLKADEQWDLKRGRCPRCEQRTYDNSLIGQDGDLCGECDILYIGKLTIED